jgi:hypothetical protein
MSTRKPHAAANGHSAIPDVATLHDLPRRQLAACNHAACAMFRGFEAIRRIQQGAAHEALAHHTAIARKLNGPCEPADLLALQADLLRFDVRRAAMYWQQLGAAVLEMQRELIGEFASMPAETNGTAAGAHGRASSPFVFRVHAQEQSSTP